MELRYGYFYKIFTEHHWATVSGYLAYGCWNIFVVKQKKNEKEKKKFCILPLGINKYKQYKSHF